MSALDFTARALAMRAGAQAPLSFTELRDLRLPASVTRIESSGYSAAGLGAGSYVSDMRADAALHAEHPAAVFAGASGQFFRLTGGEAGFVTPEQFGCPAYVPGVNAQPYIQAAVSYAEAFGYGVLFPQEDYEIWCPVRTPVAGAWDDGEGVDDGNGHPICIHRRVEFVAGPRGTRFRRKTYQGLDPAVFANTQTMADSYGYGYWRGGMFALIGQADAPADREDLASLVLRGTWQILGGLPRSANPGLYSSTSPYRLHPSGNGWDVYDRAIWASADEHTGDVEFHGDILIDGFRGELIFRAGLYAGNIIQRGRLTCSNCDANVFDGAWNDEQVVDCENIVAENVYLFCERAIGFKSRFGKITLRDVVSAESNWNAGVTLTSSPATSEQARVTIDHLHMERVPGFKIGRNMEVSRITCIDASFSIGHYYQSAWNVRIGQAEIIADRANIPNAITWYAGSSDAAGTMATQDCFISEVRFGRTPHAVANNFYPLYPLTWRGSLGPNNFVGRMSGPCYWAPLQSSATDAVTVDYRVGIGDLSCLDIQNTGQRTQNVETTPTIAYVAAAESLLTTTASAHVTCTLPNMTGKLPLGSKFVTRPSPASNGTISVATANTNLPARAILPNGQRTTWEWAGTFWRLSDRPHRLTGSTTATLQKAGAAIPAGDVSDETTLTVIGAKAGMRVTVTPSTVISGDAMLIGRVTADNTVGIRAQNLNRGSALAIGSANYRVELEWAS